MHKISNTINIIVIGAICSSCAPLIQSGTSSPQTAFGLINNTATQLTPNSSSTMKPSLQKLPNGHYTVLEDWPVTVNNKNFIVQKGYTSNGITAPQSIKNLLGDHINAPETWTAVFHDWCFTQKNLTRQECDNLYIQLMKDFSISPHKVQLMGATVKGYSIYKGN